MLKSKLTFILFLLCFVGRCFGKTTEEPFYSSKETLFSTKTGKVIGEVLLSIAPKSATTTNNEWILSIGEQGGKIIEARNETTLWIFSKKTNTDQFKKDLKNQDYPVEVKGIREFQPFCENGIRFSLKDWDELRKQTQVSFFINASPGEKVTLRLVFYSANFDKKRTNIDDEARVKLEFEIPDPSSYATQTRRTGSGGTQGGEVISLTEKITPEAVAAAAALKSEAQREDSIARAEAVNRGQRITLLNAFISEQNMELNLFQQDVNNLFVDKKAKVSESTLDSLSTIAEVMKKRVDDVERNYSDILTDILPAEKTTRDEFTKLSLAHKSILMKIEELRQRQNPLNGIMTFVKENLLLSIGGGIGAVVFLKFFMKFLKKMTSLIKSKIKQQISKAKADAKKKAMEAPKKLSMRKKKKKEQETDDEFENIDISDLAEI